MATVKYEVLRHNMRKDKTWNVVIRVTHKRVMKYISTTVFVTRKELTSSFKIKNFQKKEKCEDILRIYRKRIEEENLEFNDMTADELIRRITRKDIVKPTFVDFVDYYRKWIKIHEKEIKGMGNYKTALNSFIKFMGRKIIDCNEMTVRLMESYVRWLGIKHRAANLYSICIKRVFNEARKTFNDNLKGEEIIKRSLEFFSPPVHVCTEKRAISLEHLRALAAIPDENRSNSSRNIARDVFLISFMMMGANSIDIFSCKWDDEGNITYERAKTKDRRPDHARIVIKPHPLLMPLIKKYACVLDKKERYVFRFNRMYKNPSGFNYNLNRGLKEIGKEIDEVGLTFYAARHTMATIAFNETDIDKMTIHDMLNHQLPVYKVTDIYIKKDFRKINEANFKLIDFVFKNIEEQKTISRQDMRQDDTAMANDFLTNVVDTGVDINWQLMLQDINTKKSWNVEIKVIYKGQCKLFGTSIFVAENDVSADGQLTNKYLVKRCDALVNSCQERISRLDLKARQYDINDLVNKLLS